MLLAMVTMATTPWLGDLDLKWTSRRGQIGNESVHVFEKYGGPAATRTPDLYRVKVAL